MTATGERAERLTRRDRLRAQTMQEIKAAARRELVAHGPGGIQLRAVAREVGLTAPALYRYFPSLDELVEALTVDLYGELCDQLEAARDAAPSDPFTCAAHAGSVVSPLGGRPPAGVRADVRDAADGVGAAAQQRLRGGQQPVRQRVRQAFLQIWDGRARSTVPGDEELAPGIEGVLRPYWTWLTDTLAPGIPIGRGGAVPRRLGAHLRHAWPWRCSVTCAGPCRGRAHVRADHAQPRRNHRPPRPLHPTRFFKLILEKMACQTR